MAAEIGSLSTPELAFRPLTTARWGDLEALFGPRGASGGCWCMWWRVSAATFAAQKGLPNQEQFRAVVEAGDVPGILAYRGATPVGWCAVAPRERFPRLLRSRLAFDRATAGVWSVVCLFVARGSRRRGVSAALLEAAVAHAGERGAQIVEGYPLEPRKGTVPDAFAWTGLAAAFRRAGFVEVARGAPTRPVMQVNLRPR